MSRPLELPDALYDALDKTAKASGVTPVDWIAARLRVEGVGGAEENEGATSRSLANLFQGRVGRIRSGGTTREKMLAVFGSGHLGETLTRRQIIAMVVEAYPGTNEGSVIPSDYCYNILNRDPSSFRCHLFEWLESSQYRVLGAGFDYEGPVYWKGHKVGEWKKGEKRPQIWKTI
jgi:hypothetical protein